ncbi:MAG: hypothetical protein D6681_10405 [Calditrichaeota bacterium]|nr:MAG: hypothetical protein D6681_10405 [Calditrichota bacterium]
MNISIGIDISPSLANSLTAVLRRSFIIVVRFQGVNGGLLLYTHYKEILLPPGGIRVTSKPIT